MNLVTRKPSESEQLQAQQIPSHSIEIPTGQTKRRPQSLFDLGESAQEIKVGPESAPTISQNSECHNETPAHSQGHQVQQTNYRYINDDDDNDYKEAFAVIVLWKSSE